MWYALDRYGLFTTQKKMVTMVKHRKPGPQTQDYAKYTQTTGRNLETLVHKCKRVQSKHIGKSVSAFMLPNQKGFSLNISRYIFLLRKKNTKNFTKKVPY